MKIRCRGTSHEMSFEVDRGGILHVSANDKAAKKSQSVTITGDKGRLSKEEIEEKVKEVAEFAEEDKRSMEKVDSWNRLESYLHNVKRSVSDKVILADRVDPEERESIEGRGGCGPRAAQPQPRRGQGGL